MFHRSLFAKDSLEVEVQPARKMTPRKKQLATKVKKTPHKDKRRKEKDRSLTGLVLPIS